MTGRGWGSGFALADEATRHVVAEDREWFAAHPGREFRLRTPRRAEVRPGAEPDPDNRRRVLVRQVINSGGGQGVRLRLDVLLSPDEQGGDDVACRRIWERCMPQDGEASHA